MLCRRCTLRAHLALQNPGSYMQVPEPQRRCRHIPQALDWHNAIPTTIPMCWQPAANITCQEPCQGLCQELQRKEKPLCFTIGPRSWHKGMRTLGVMDGDKGQGHNESH